MKVGDILKNKDGSEAMVVGILRFGEIMLGNGVRYDDIKELEHYEWISS